MITSCSMCTALSFMASQQDSPLNKLRSSQTTQKFSSCSQTGFSKSKRHAHLNSLGSGPAPVPQIVFLTTLIQAPTSSSAYSTRVSGPSGLTSMTMTSDPYLLVGEVNALVVKNSPRPFATKSSLAHGTSSKDMKPCMPKTEKLSSSTQPKTQPVMAPTLRQQLQDDKSTTSHFSTSPMDDGSTPPPPLPLTAKSPCLEHIFCWA
jgi:hypothetical protein